VEYFFNYKIEVMGKNKGFKEGPVAKTIEKQTARIPSDVYLWAALGTMALSLGLFIAKKKHSSLFFGQWAPSILIMGLYNKVVKVEGHEGGETSNKQDKEPANRGMAQHEWNG
jgi:hypothetical protein